MDKKRSYSSVKVLFSDKGSASLGILSIIVMIAVSFTLFILKFQRNTQFQIANKAAPRAKFFRYSKNIFYPAASKDEIIIQKLCSFSKKKILKRQN